MITREILELGVKKLKRISEISDSISEFNEMQSYFSYLIDLATVAKIFRALRGNLTNQQLHLTYQQLTMINTVFAQIKKPYRLDMPILHKKEMKDLADVLCQ